MHIRPATSEDGPAVAALIEGVYAEYGELLCLEGADSDLLDLEANYTGKSGEFVVLDDDGRVRGSHAMVPIEGRPGLCTFRRLYLDPELRGGEWGQQLMDWAIERATEHGFDRVEFWSDVRFERAHQFFKRFGFQSDGTSRVMNDGVTPYSEYFFFLDLNH